MNTGQRAERFIHATVAWNKAVCAEPYLQQAGYLYRYRLLYGHAQTKRLFQKSGFGIHIFRRPDLPAAASVQYLSVL